MNRDIFKLESKPRRSENEEQLLRIAKRDKEVHLKRAEDARYLYHRKRNKASSERYMSQGYLSMIIDGAGAQAR